VLYIHVAADWIAFLTHLPNKGKLLKPRCTHVHIVSGNMKFNLETVAKPCAPFWTWTYPSFLSVVFASAKRRLYQRLCNCPL